MSGHSLIDVLTEDVLLAVCSFLPGNELFLAGATGHGIRSRTQDCTQLWRGLCDVFLGPALLALHELAWQNGSCHSTLETAAFYQKLFKAAWNCGAFRYNHDLRKTVLDNFKAQVCLEESERSAVEKRVLARSGHTSETIGKTVYIIGGMGTGSEGVEQVMPVATISLAERRLCIPKLSLASARPSTRMRHASCVVNPGFLPGGSEQRAILVTGGYARQPGQGASIMPGLQRLTLLQPTSEDGSEICWHEFDASGPVPEAVYHHQCGSFRRGKRVVVFGGDVPDDDPEIFALRERSMIAFVYILDLDSRMWEKVVTTGTQPSWRSLHIGVTYTGLADRHEHFIMMGGTSEQTDPFSGGEAADMIGYSLDLETFRWQKGRPDGFQPVPRLRFGGERIGRHLVVYGGYCEEGSGIPEEQRIIALNLVTLRWRRVRVLNKPASHPNAPGAGLRGGCIVGGVQMGILGVRLVKKLEFLCLSNPDLPSPADHESDEAELASAESSDDSGAVVTLRVQQPDGSVRALRLPYALAAEMSRNGMIRHADESDSDEPEDDTSEDES